MPTIFQSVRVRSTLPLALGIALLALFFSAFATAEPAAPEIRWKMGSGFQQHLRELQVGFEWTANPLRPGLENLSRRAELAILLDRRVDPDQLVNLTVKDVPFDAAVGALAEKLQLKHCVLSSVIYLGPAYTARRLPTVAALRRREVAALPAPRKALWLKPQACRWPALSQPRQLAVDLAGAANQKLLNPELIPLDVWPAIDLPPLPLADRLTLVLVGFDLTYDWGDEGITLVPFPDQAVIEQTYSAAGFGGKLVTEIQKIAPDATATRSGDSLKVTASFEDHDKIARLLAGERVHVTKITPSAKRYTLTVKNQPAGAVVSTVAGDLKKEIRYSSELREKLTQRISLEVKDVSLDELLTKTLAPLGLTYRLKEAELQIVPAK